MTGLVTRFSPYRTNGMEPTMTAFDLFQIATCEIAAGKRAAAAATLTHAIRQIDRDKVDAELRPDLVALRQSLTVVPA